MSSVVEFVLECLLESREKILCTWRNHNPDHGNHCGGLGYRKQAMRWLFEPCHHNFVLYCQGVCGWNHAVGLVNSGQPTYLNLGNYVRECMQDALPHIGGD